MNEKHSFDGASMQDIDQVRFRHGIPKAQLCARANVHPTTYRKYLMGTHTRMAGLTINRIRRALEAMVAESDARKVLG